jgi:hypothetical protein
VGLVLGGARALAWSIVACVIFGLFVASSDLLGYCKLDCMLIDLVWFKVEFVPDCLSCVPPLGTLVPFGTSEVWVLVHWYQLVPVMRARPSLVLALPLHILLVNTETLLFVVSGKFLCVPVAEPRALDFSVLWCCSLPCLCLVWVLLCLVGVMRWIAVSLLPDLLWLCPLLLVLVCFMGLLGMGIAKPGPWYTGTSRYQWCRAGLTPCWVCW